MATQIATTDEQPQPRKVAVMSGNKLAAFVPQSLEEAWRLAGALAQSGMTPKAYGNDQNKVMVGILAGAEVGLTPFAALQSIAVIGNNPSLWGDGALALVQASGLLDDMEETDDGNKATCRLNRKDRKTPIVRSFSMDDAKRAGLAGKAGPWTQYPARMRQMRARAFALRDGFSDVLKGLHIVEEVRDYAPMDGGTLGDIQPLTGQMLIEQAASDRPSPAALAPDDAPAGTAGETSTSDEQEEALDSLPARADADHGDGFTDDEPDYLTLASVMCKNIARCETVIDVASIVASSKNWPDDARKPVVDAGEARKLVLKGEVDA